MLGPSVMFIGAPVAFNYFCVCSQQRFGITSQMVLAISHLECLFVLGMLWIVFLIVLPLDLATTRRQSVKIVSCSRDGGLIDGKRRRERGASGTKNGAATVSYTHLTLPTKA